MAISLTLELPTHLEERLTQEAERKGLDIEQYALTLLGAEPEAAAPPMNGAELVAYWQREGLIGSRSDIEDSQAHAREIREQARSYSS